MYKKMIVEDTGCEPSQAPAVEEMMRAEHGTLDGLTRAQFRAAAKRAMAACLALGTVRRRPLRSP